MEVIRNVQEMKSKISEVKGMGRSIGLVPTMGYLHAGHKSLIDRARKENNTVVVSIFVNPIQFGPNEDFERYPRDEKRDFELCRDAGCDFIFMPERSDMFNGDFSTYVEVMGLTEGLCGASRPGHFRGVTTIVTKLFNIVKPDRAYFGQKDAQQLSVIRRMVRDLDVDIEIVGCPIVREEDGLALSSRNVYLSGDERKDALVLSRALQRAKELIGAGFVDTMFLKGAMKSIIAEAPSSEVDYIEIVDNGTLKSVDTVEGEVLIALAVRIGKTRLIDNMVVVK